MAKKTYDNVAQCPGCGVQDASKVGYVWWGGLIVPKMLHLAQCSKCGVMYNGKTGKDQSKAWLYYFLLPLLIVAAIISVGELVYNYL